ncbi:MAG: UDP-glucose 4-epimerase GalE [Caldilineales bacterium]|nr:UDP-glucose 4-epimerase GalE [Caldilineales bacterium]
MAKRVFVSGGCGYIGSHTVRALQRRGLDVIVFDDLIKGHRQAVNGAPVITGNLLSQADIRAVFAEYPHIDGVIHFAAHVEPNESMRGPGKYFQNNVQGCVNLLDAMTEAGVQHIVFSSTCAVYGTPDAVPVKETAPLKPESVYGASKLMAEQAIHWYGVTRTIRSVALRYFNAAGSSLDGRIGDAYDPAIRIIPSLIKYLLGQRPTFTLFGDDYPTPDGSCIRDYIHVEDLANAHIAALEYLWNNGESEAFNLGMGYGVSNFEIIDMVQEVTGLDFEIQIGPRRQGDPARIFADITHAQDLLGWQPHHDLRTIIESDWRWHSAHPNGYDY